MFRLSSLYNFASYAISHFCNYTFIKIASYAASNVDESEAKVINNSNKGPESPSNHAVSKREQNYYYDDHHHHAPGSGLVIPQKSSTPITPSQQQQHHESRYLHPLALKLKMQG